MNRVTNFLSGPPLEDERILLRMVTDAYAATSAWSGAGGERNAIEHDIRHVAVPAALGLSPEFQRWSAVAESAGVMWDWEIDERDGHGYVVVTY